MRIATAVVCFVAAMISARAEDAAKPSAADILGKVDHAINDFKDAVWESKLRVRQPSGEAREYGFTTFQKVPGKRLVRFTAPGDVAGMGVLVETADTIYVYLPEFKKVRRMGTHVKNQTFMGSDFSFEDMSQTTYSSTFVPKLVGEENGNYILELTQKAGLDLEFPRMKMWVGKEHEQPTRLELMDGSGKTLKTQERLDYKKAGEHWQPGRIVVTDHRRNDHTSEIVFVTSKFNSGLADDIFSVRSLQR